MASRFVPKIMWMSKSWSVDSRTCASLQLQKLSKNVAMGLFFKRELQNHGSQVPTTPPRSLLSPEDTHSTPAQSALAIAPRTRRALTSEANSTPPETKYLRCWRLGQGSAFGLYTGLSCKVSLETWGFATCLQPAFLTLELFLFLRSRAYKTVPTYRKGVCLKLRLVLPSISWHILGYLQK